MAFDSQVSSEPSVAPSNPTSPEALPVLAERTPSTSGPAPIWLQRLSLFVLVLFCVYLGVLVLILPWWPRVWDQNGWIHAHPALAALLHTGAVRGLISGLGLLDIWVGLSEAIHYRDHRPQA